MTRQIKTELSYPERLDIPQVTLAEAKEQILMSIELKQKRGAIVLVGESGLGKTQIFGQIAREIGYNLRVIHTAHWGLMGSGIPRKAEGDFFDVAIPSSFPKPGEKCILLFDELNRGLKHAIDQFFSLLEDGRMFNYTLPEDCIVAGTMNPDTENYSVTNIENEAAIRRRLKLLYVLPEFSGWYNHAKSNEFHANTKGPARGKACHPHILEYFKAHPRLLYDGKARDAGKQYICPATVETISEDAYNAESQKIALDSDFVRLRMAASIGNTETTQLIEFLRDSSAMLNATDILNGYKKKAQKAIQSLKGEDNEKLANLCQDIVSSMFADQPDPVKTADCLLRFWKDVPAQLSNSMMEQFQSVAAISHAEKYLTEVMAALADHDDWVELLLRKDTVHQEMDAEVNGSRR